MWHRSAPFADGHIVHSLEYANATARTGDTSLLSTDIGRVCLQLDTASFWILTNYSPVTWQAVGGAAVVVPDDTLIFGAAGVGTSTTLRYLVSGYTPNTAPIQSPGIRSEHTGILLNMRVKHNVAGVGGNIIYTLYLNGSATALTATAAASASGGVDLTHTVAVSADDIIDIRVTKSSSITTSPADVVVSIGFSA